MLAMYGTDMSSSLDYIASVIHVDNNLWHIQIRYTMSSELMQVMKTERLGLRLSGIGMCPTCSCRLPSASLAYV